MKKKTEFDAFSILIVLLSAYLFPLLIVKSQIVSSSHFLSEVLIFALLFVICYLANIYLSHNQKNFMSNLACYVGFALLFIEVVVFLII